MFYPTFVKNVSCMILIGVIVDCVSWDRGDQFVSCEAGETIGGQGQNDEEGVEEERCKNEEEKEGVKEEESYEENREEGTHF